MLFNFRRLVLILAFLSVGCTKYSEYKKDESGRVFITPMGAKIDDYRVTKWRVGKYWKDQVSKGLTVNLRIPVLENKFLSELAETKSVDSWVIEVKKVRLGKSEILGYLYVPIYKPDGKKFKVGQTKNVTVAVFYAAAVVSTQFNKINCPPFGHNKVIGEINESKIAQNYGKIIAVTAIEDAPINEKVLQFGFNTMVFNGGMSLQGTYSFRVALYNSDEQRRKSSFYTIRDSLTVVNEKEEDVEGCVGDNNVHPKEVSPIDQFKFGR